MVAFHVTTTEDGRKLEHPRNNQTGYRENVNISAGINTTQHLRFSIQQTWHNSESSSLFAHVHSISLYFSQIDPAHCLWGKNILNLQWVEIYDNSNSENGKLIEPVKNNLI